MICCHCEQRKRPSAEDPDFCQECYDEIEHNVGVMMERAAAMRCYFNSCRQRAGNKMKVYAFLSVIHPEMSERRRREIMAAVED